MRTFIRRFRAMPLALDASWVMLGQAVGYALRLIYFIVLARLLGVVQYGIVIGAFALVNLAAPYCSLGSGRLLLQYVSPDTRLFTRFWGNVLLVTFAISGVVVVLLRLLAPHVLDPASASVVAATAMSVCLCEQVNLSAGQAFQAFQQMRTGALLNQSSSALRTMTALGLFFWLGHVTAATWCYALLGSSAISCLIAIAVVTVKLGRPRLSPDLIFRYGLQGGEFAFAASTSSAYDDMDKALLSHYGMDAANGVYSLAYRIIDMATVPIISLQSAADPRLCKLAAADEATTFRLGRTVLKNGIFLGFTISLGVFLSAPLIPVVLGPGFAQTVMALRWLALIPLFRSMHQLSGSVLTCTGRQRYRTIAQVITVVVNLALGISFIPTYGWRGAAAASLITDASLAFMNCVALCAVERQARPVVPDASVVAVRA